MQKQSPPPALTLAQVQKVRRFGALDVMVVAFKPTRDEHALLREEIQSWHADSAADKRFSVDTGAGTLFVGEKAFKRVVKNMAGLAKLLGRSFFKLCSFSLANLDENVVATVRPRFVTKTRTGSREWKWIPKSAEADDGQATKAA